MKSPFSGFHVVRIWKFWKLIPTSDGITLSVIAKAVVVDYGQYLY